ncbi:hypothetical protein LCGC14_2913660 [marine sediment metagenome]|uniref:Uncharacterized protein n=1 Tax=marine sediment metagenome TaxID=412755 RepID=A0A0F8ZYK9_9ZZZZ
MSKIYLFLPDFKALVKGTLFVSENEGPNHPVLYYEDETQIYFYKPRGAFVYCFQSIKAVETKGVTDTLGITKEEIDNLKQEFGNPIEVPRKLYVTHIETTTTGSIRQ